MVLLLILGDLHIPHRAIDLPPKFKKLLVPGKIHQIICTGNLCSRETLDYLRTVSPDVTAVIGDYDDASLFPSLAHPSAAPAAGAATAGAATSSFLGYPISRVVTVGAIRIGAIHGHTVIPWGDPKALAAVARQLDVDVLVHGHTHCFEAFESEGRFFINPGSATGAFSPLAPLPVAPKSQEDGVAPDAAAPDSASKDGEGAEESVASPAPAAVEKPKPAPPAGIVPSFVLLDVQGSMVVVYVYKLVNGDVKVEKLEYTKRTHD
ncbi:Metallo-dependent phosphatase-like protein [Zopfochytrium polystomum]|nr:Metallo-dependent phosphatase-like protein [Zopfochytrium polystomum]